MTLAPLLASTLCHFTQILTGVRAIWRGTGPERRQCVYFANHRSHGDFVLIWAALPPHLRRATRPVAAADYWLGGTLRRYVAERVFRAVLIHREVHRHQANPIDAMGEALVAGDSLIMFPEGTRNLGEGLLPFKGGLYHLAKAHPDIPLIPVWIENLGRVMPKGSLVPVPLLCSLTFGAPLTLTPGEPKTAFLNRASQALLALAPPAD